jgi:DNA mismatch repair protein MutH
MLSEKSTQKLPMPSTFEKYNGTSPSSIESYGKRLVSKTLRGVRGAAPIPTKYLSTSQGTKTKAAFGFMLERFYYGINPPNESKPDFPQAGVELKSTPLKRLRDGKFSAKERLVLNLINYHEEVKNSFTSSIFLKKNGQIMLVAYLHEDDRMVVDYIIKIAELVSFNGLSEADRIIIEQDWKKIVEKIRAGHADQLSEGDTLYLAACTKAANSKVFRTAPGGIMAKPRAFSLKAGFMTNLMRGLMDTEPAIKNVADLKKTDFEALVEKRFEPFLGMSVENIKKKVGQDLNVKSKDFFASLARRMMGVKKRAVEEFEKADVMMKAIRVSKNGTPPEDISFPIFRYMDIINEKWDEADRGTGTPSPIKIAFEKKFFFVVFQCGEDPHDLRSMRLKKVVFWNMPAKDLEEVKWVWKETIKRIKAGKADQLPKMTENNVSHIRPHGRNAADTLITPHNGMQVKKCFWLNRAYIREQILND